MCSGDKEDGPDEMQLVQGQIQLPDGHEAYIMCLGYSNANMQLDGPGCQHCKDMRVRVLVHKALYCAEHCVCCASAPSSHHHRAVGQEAMSAGLRRLLKQPHAGPVPKCAAHLGASTL